jgi:calcineurin-like phosphoesterase family protein
MDLHFIRDKPPFFTADTHFGHMQALFAFNRQFDGLYAMNEVMINNWNSIVEPDRIVYHIGDFGFWNVQDLTKIFMALNGHKILIVGNNDCEQTLRLPWVDRVKSLRISVEGQEIFMSHYPRKSNKRRAGVWYLHGHQHCIGQRLLDVGVDCWNFFPITFEQAKEVHEGHLRGRARTREPWVG